LGGGKICSIEKKTKKDICSLAKKAKFWRRKILLFCKRLGVVARQPPRPSRFYVKGRGGADEPPRSSLFYVARCRRRGRTAAGLVACVFVAGAACSRAELALNVFFSFLL